MPEEDNVNTPLEETTEEEEQKDWKALYEAEVKAGAGKDKKITQLLEAKNKKDEDDKKQRADRRRAELQNLTVEQYREYLDRALEEKEREKEQEKEELIAQYRREQRKGKVLDVLAQVENIPEGFMPFLTRMIELPDDSNDIKDVIQNFIDTINSQFIKQRIVIDNKRKVDVSSRPGSINKSFRINEKDLDKLSEQDQRALLKNASDEEVTNLLMDQLNR